MKLIFEDRHSRTIKTKEEIRFFSFSSYHLIIITARAKSEKQLSRNSTDDEDLTVKIDKDKTFPQLRSNRLIDSPAALSGGRLHNLSKTIYFLTFLKGRDHKIILKTDKPTDTATFENLQIHVLDPTKKLTLEPKLQAEDGDRRPWITFVLDNLAIQSITPTLTYSRHDRDSDDVKITIDGKTQGNPLRTIKHFLWRYAGSLLPWVSPTKTQTEIFTINLPQDLHYIEFDADRIPTLNKLVLDFGKTLPLPAGLPTVDNPKWTGDFYDDTDKMILARAIFGEARDELYPDKARIAVGWSIRNRVEDSRWANSYHEVIIKPEQYSAFNETDRNRPYIENPFWKDNDVDKTAWYNCFDIAGKVINGELKDPTSGANHYYDNSISTPYWATKETLALTIERSDNKAMLIFHKL